MQIYRFGDFELDLDAQQLRQGGRAVPIERRPFRLIALLVSQEGRAVAREEIIAALWPANVIIDFDSGLNTLVRKARAALGDSSEEPRYIETISGWGYRFIAPIEQPSRPEPEPASSPARPRRRILAPVVTAAVVLLVLVIGSTLYHFRTAPDEAERIRIAVLPFENLTGDSSLDYLAAGLADETTTSLARIDLPNLSVIGSVSASALSGSSDALVRMRRDLDIDFGVLSSLRLDGSLIRVTSRLIRVSDGEQVWSASFDRQLTNVLGIQRELSIAIAEQVRQTLSPEVAAAIDARQTQNPEAYELYLKGRYEWVRFQPDSVSRAIDYYRQAVAIDPGYALAWAGIAHAIITSRVTAEADPDSIRPAALDPLQRALEGGPDLAETQLALGSFQFFLDHDYASAEITARRAIALDPNSAMCHMFLGIVLAQQGKDIEARAMLRRGRELDPLFPLMFANSAIVALMAGEPAEALEHATQAVAMDPEFWVGYLHLGSAKLALGDLEGAEQAYENADKFSGHTSSRATTARAHVLIRLGRTDEARELLAELTERSRERYVPPTYLAGLLVALGDPDAAFDMLEQELAQGRIDCLDLEDHPRLKPLWSDPRLDSLLRRCRLSP